MHAITRTLAHTSRKVWTACGKKGGKTGGKKKRERERLEAASHKGVSLPILTQLKKAGHLHILQIQSSKSVERQRKKVRRKACLLDIFYVALAKATLFTLAICLAIYSAKLSSELLHAVCSLRTGKLAICLLEHYTTVLLTPRRP